MRDDLAAVDAALLRGDVTAGEPEARAMQSLAPGLRAVAPRPSEAFVEGLTESVLAWIVVGHGPVKVRVLVAHRHPMLRRGVAGALAANPRLEVVGEAADESSTLALAHRVQPNVVAVDAQLRGGDDMGVVERLRAEIPAVHALVLTTRDTIDTGAAARDPGASGCVSQATRGADLCKAVIEVAAGGEVLTPEQCKLVLGWRPPHLLTANELEICQRLADGLAPGGRLVSRRHDPRCP